MRCLVITDNPPVYGLKERAFGSYHRFRAFVLAIAEICDDIEILHFIDADYGHAPDRNATTLIQGANEGRAAKISIGKRKQWQLWEMPLAPFSLKHDSKFAFLLGNAQISRI